MWIEELNYSSCFFSTLFFGNICILLKIFHFMMYKREFSQVNGKKFGLKNSLCNAHQETESKINQLNNVD